ncbi:CehA/McbA family metallohydrolase [Tuwongella immobilis]|uniref:Hypothetical conserved protein n=1 Tax=Tuwongella immobilis TaxID=692036 RepID=A0A6C2YLT2_9BACT|nr:CehA/McbA family metallohydrolase [Tuwongella immobilis]VIP02386.1 Hypothetical conserved protein OS=uncultured planctomycete GN=HGMM_F09D09C15 PE=4 SV=1 [Tuwongella immobilis]VTS01244.1 Hypothetical conserved protein OS=uncultured planctomycete GN=HGMM_F09D09C15 PE=4 SV=1 [Tuwongella immobilis]
MGLQTVHVRVNDAATKLPTPVRLRITGPDGVSFPPFGHPWLIPVGPYECLGNNLRFGTARYSLINGACEIQLPTQVPLEVEILKGPEFRPIRTTVTLNQGQMALRFVIERISDLRSEGWLAGDGRVHGFSPHEAHLQAQAEDVAIVNLLATATMHASMDGHCYETIPQMAAYSGQQPALAGDGAWVAVNTFQQHPMLGQVALLHTHRAVFPLVFGGMDATDDWSIVDWCEQAHRKRGLTVWCDAFRQDRGLMGGECLLAALRGEIDAFEFDHSERPMAWLSAWYRLLNLGVTLPLVGSSAKRSNGEALGGMRTYARIAPDAEPGVPAWIEAVRAGRTWITNGPLLRVTIGGSGPGETIPRTAISADGMLPATIRLQSLVPVQALEILADGEAVQRIEVPELADGQPFDWQGEIPAGQASWFSVRTYGAAKSLLQPTSAVFAHTSPIGLAEPTWAKRAAAVPAVVRMLERLIDWSETEGRYSEARWKEQLVGYSQFAIRKLQANS